jgi:hypothetical protein
MDRADETEPVSAPVGRRLGHHWHRRWSDLPRRESTNTLRSKAAWDMSVRALYDFQCQTDGERAKDEGWKWMERFFEQPEKRSVTTSPYLYAEKINGFAEGYAEAGLTTIIARIASDDTRGQARRLLNEIKPQLGF